MATTKRTNHRVTEPEGFAVTLELELGRVTFDPDGDQHPTVAAFNIIATYEADHPGGGTFRFPTPDGSTAIVAVSYEGRDS